MGSSFSMIDENITLKELNRFLEYYKENWNSNKNYKPIKNLYLKPFGEIGIIILRDFGDTYSITSYSFNDIKHALNKGKY